MHSNETSSETIDYAARSLGVKNKILNTQMTFIQSQIGVTCLFLYSGFH